MRKKKYVRAENNYINGELWSTYLVHFLKMMPVWALGKCEWPGDDDIAVGEIQTYSEMVFIVKEP